MSVLTVTPRKIFLQDLEVTTDPNAEPIEVYVGGVGDTPLDPIAMVLYSAFGQYADDATATSHGIVLGQIYYNTTISALKARSN